MNFNIDEHVQRVTTRTRGRLIVISGPSGVGKGTLVKALMDQDDPQLTLSISMTTRSPREGEVEGRNYFFTQKEDFEAQAERNAFLEYATYNNNHYGTPRDFVEKQIQTGRDVILEIDVQGAKQVRDVWDERVIQIFILPPDANTLRERLIARKTESADVIAQRLEKVEKEISQLPLYDYFVVNDSLDQAVRDLQAIIQAERHRINLLSEEC